MPRLDRVLVARGLARSRTEAQSLIAAHTVFVNGQVAEKSSQSVTEESKLTIVGERCPYVSRGGWKLQAALDGFQISVAGRTALDVGASTGGFTDCLLQRAIQRVVAIDVGHGQISPKLAADPRVELREGINIRAVQPQDFDVSFDLVVADLSFISLSLVLPALRPLLQASGDLLCLIKPQFEVGVHALGKGGIVRDSRAQEGAVHRVISAGEICGFVLRGCMCSPILGGGGNKEFIAWFQQEVNAKSGNTLTDG